MLAYVEFNQNSCWNTGARTVNEPPVLPVIFSRSLSLSLSYICLFICYFSFSFFISRLATGFPDARTCLLHQKLQMLNCCIERKNAREAMIADREFSSAESSENECDDDEEFFDCSTDMEKPRQSVGRLGKFEDMKLLQTGEQLYIPITQDPVPKTEDQLEEDTDILLKLGSDAAGSELRARMMSASLLSDMESFKAANPGSILEDFIRWYSPRDWIEEEGVDEWGQKKGKLSSRMLISDNTWVEMWTTAKAVPANRQKRLFDDTREAEKVLHFLDSRSIGQIGELLVPVLAQVAICRVMDECDVVDVAMNDSQEALQKITKICERLTRESKVNMHKYEAMFLELVDLELTLSQANSLLYKFNPSGSKDNDLNVMVGDLIRGVEVEIEERADSLVGERLVTMFSDAQKALNMIVHDQAQVPKSTTFPLAAKREFVLRVSSHRPAAYSARCPQLMRAVLSRSEFRLCGAFTEDIVFF
ncbi:PREDICTED: rab3 GTPase-activating protein catalytic subunit-like [Nicrophorus vespilloides]|uniref:Rab3 GTPase-activating protein catalytic subunit n=1 Tax=Nicrophorus vespilloides TaxID=110193 RepID=A0ABM1M5R3_NICVS|nr:PREDICTED: rab3 GTPase-activating protein catalytic subunit-like [Nicrophorus vespilloides]